MGSFSFTFVRRIKSAVPGSPQFRRPHGKKMTQRLIIRNLGTRLRFVRTSRFLIGSLHLSYLSPFADILCATFNKKLKTTNGKS